jgi:hypothetical protein
MAGDEPLCRASPNTSPDEAIVPTFIAVTPPSDPILVTVGGSQNIIQPVAGAGPSQVSVGQQPSPALPEPLLKPRGMAWMMSTKASGSISISATTASGFFTVRWWDGQVQVVGPASAASPLFATRAISSTGDWSGSSPKEVYVWAGNRTQSGELLSLSAASAGAVFLDVSGCESLESLNCATNSLSSLDLSRTPSLRFLYCQSNSLQVLDTSLLPLLRELYCQANGLPSLNLAGNRRIEVLQCNNNQLTGLSLDGLTALTRLYCHYNLLTLLDLRPATSLREVNCVGNLLTSVRAAGLRLSGALAGVFSQNQLSAQALNLLYSDLAATTGGSLYVSSNPGTSSDTTSIATSKGYTIYGS